MLRPRIGQLLLDAGRITEAQLTDALTRQHDTRDPLGHILCAQEAITEDTLLEFLGQQYGLVTVSPLPADVDPRLAACLPHDWAERYTAVPTSLVGQRLTVAMADPAHVSALDDVRFRTGLRVVPVVALASEIRQRIHALYVADGVADGHRSSTDAAAASGVVAAADAAADTARSGTAHSTVTHSITGALHADDMTALVDQATASLRHTSSDAVADTLAADASPVAQLVQTIIQRAAHMGVSDVHLEPSEQAVQVRFRLDGTLHTMMTYALTLRNAVVSRLKILSHLDIAERRLPQDGRFTLAVAPASATTGDASAGTSASVSEYRRANAVQTLDIRLSTLPALHGEKIVLRLLNRAGQLITLPALGFAPAEIERLLAALASPHGMLLVTGPTGSGKTTTLYAALQVLNTPDVNIVTVEDPVEYHLPGITQVHVKEDIGLGFAQVLRSVLRQDPDIMMVGEIRDLATAHIAIRAALTGHRVLSTLHTHDAVRAVTRLIDMGVEPFMVASSVSVIVAQRLVRRVCAVCQRPAAPLGVTALRALGFTEEDAAAVVPVRGQGCAACHGTGYKGRVGLYEVLPVSPAFRARIMASHTADHLKRQALADGLVTVRRSGLDAIKRGLTTVEEVVSVSVED